MRSFVTNRWLDGVVVALAVFAQIDVWTDPAQTPRLVAAPAALLWTLPLLLRRRSPLGAPAVVFATLGAESLLSGQVVTSNQVNPFALLAAFWVAGSHPNARRALAGGTLGFVAVAAIVLHEVPDSSSAVPVFLLGAGAWAIGRTYAERERRAQELQHRAERLERENTSAVLAERARLARELHDVIAHSVSVMTIQAGAARMLLEEEPARAREPLASVEKTGRQTLAELRRLLGILREAEDDPTLAPQPGMAQMDALIRQVRAAGVPVEVTAEGKPRPLTAGVDLTAYRIVQEALTNVLRHAGGSRARVHVRYGAGTLELEVTNDGKAPSEEPGGHGLIGMQQRVALYGGRLDAGPRPQGGYAVRAQLPLTGSDA